MWVGLGPQETPLWSQLWNVIEAAVKYSSNSPPIWWHLAASKLPLTARSDLDLVLCCAVEAGLRNQLIIYLFIFEIGVFFPFTQLVRFHNISPARSTPGWPWCPCGTLWSRKARDGEDQRPLIQWFMVFWRLFIVYWYGFKWPKCFCVECCSWWLKCILCW